MLFTSTWQFTYVHNILVNIRLLGNSLTEISRLLVAGVPLEKQTVTGHKTKHQQSRSGSSSTADKGDSLKHQASISLHQTVGVQQLEAKSTAATHVHSGSDIMMTKQERRESDTSSLKAECSLPSADSSPLQRLHVSYSLILA